MSRSKEISDFQCGAFLRRQSLRRRVIERARNKFKGISISNLMVWNWKEHKGKRKVCEKDVLLFAQREKVVGYIHTLRSRKK